MNKFNMQKQRIFTGLILGILVILAILYLPLNGFIITTSIVMLFAAWEWGLLMNNHSLIVRFIYVFCIGGLMFFSLFLPILWVLFAASAWWIIAFILVLFYPCVTFWSKGTWIRGVMGGITIIPSWLSLNAVHSAANGASSLLFLVFLICATDTGAYFVGKYCGKHKLIPNVSPSKTWEGLFGGVFLALIVGVAASWMLNIDFQTWPKKICLIVIAALFSVIGDLHESMLKRSVNIKDTGAYLPGHGGLLDRMDSINAAAPMFLLGCFLLGLS